MYSLYYGHVVFKSIWDELKLPDTIANFDSGDLTAAKLNALLFYLSCGRALYTHHFFDPLDWRYNFVYCPWDSCTDDDFYRALDFLAAHGSQLITAIAATARTLHPTSSRKAWVTRQDYQFLLAFDPQGYPLTYYPIADSDEATIGGISTILKTELGIKTITPALYDELPPKVQRSGSKIWGLRLSEVLPDAPDSEFSSRCCLSLLALMLLKELQAKLTQRGLKLTIDKIGASLRTIHLIALGQPTYEKLILLKAACEVPETRFFDQIFSLVDLAPLHYANNVAIIKQRLKLQDTPDELLISPVCLDSIKRQRKELELDDDPLLKLKSEQ